MAIKRTKYCQLKTCKKPIKVGQFCSMDCCIKQQLINIQKMITVKKATSLGPSESKLIGSPAERINQYKKRLKKRIKPRSKKRQKEYEEYNRIRPIFLEGKICPITKRPATEIHHKKGKIGKLLCDIRYFLGVTREGHEWIENNPEEAYRLGYSIKRTAKEE